MSRKLIIPVLLWSIHGFTYAVTWDVFHGRPTGKAHIKLVEAIV